MNVSREVPKSRLRPGDLVTEALAGILQRPGRTTLTVLGVVLGIGTFVAVLGVAATATGQISKRFTELAATEVTVEDVTPPDSRMAPTAFPHDADARVERLNGVRAAGVFWTLPAADVGPVTGVPLPGVAVSDQIPVIAASPGLFAAVRAQVSPGRPFSGVHDARGDRVAVVGKVVAQRLGITRLDVRPAIMANGVTLTVVGIVDSVQRRPELLAAVWVPRTTAVGLWPGHVSAGEPPRMVVDTDLGAAKVVAEQVSLALRPEAPGSFRAQAPPDPRQLRDAVNTDLASLFLVLAAISLAVGAIGIANTTLVAVLERVPEIGLRRTLGARRRHIVSQFLCESTALGLIGGLVAAGLGVAVVVVVAVSQQWTPIMEPWTVAMAPALGGMTGLVSGAYPAFRASRIEPAAALRH